MAPRKQRVLRLSVVIDIVTNRQKGLYYYTEALRQAKEKAAQKYRPDWEQGKATLRGGYRKTDAIIME